MAKLYSAILPQSGQWQSHVARQKQNMSSSLNQHSPMILHKLWYLSDSRYILLILWIPCSRALYGRASSPLMLTGHSVVINVFTVAYSLIANREPKRLEWDISPLPGSIIAVSLELTRILKKNNHRTPSFRTYFNSATSGNVERWKRGIEAGRACKYYLL